MASVHGGFAASLCGEVACLQVTFLVRAAISSLRSLEEKDAANVLPKKGQVDRIRITVIQQLSGGFAACGRAIFAVVLCGWKLDMAQLYKKGHWPNNRQITRILSSPSFAMGPFHDHVTFFAKAVAGLNDIEV